MKNLTCAFALGAVGLSAALCSADDGQYSIPFAARAPVVDGVESEGEWDGAFRVVGAGRPVDARRAEIAFSWDSDHLYVMAKGETEIYEPEYIDRGYEHIEKKLRSLGASIRRESIES